MPVDTQQLLDEAEKLGQLVAQHPMIGRYKQAQKSLADDAEANRLLADFERQIEVLSRQEQSGMPVTDAQRLQLESVQGRIVSNLKIKAWNQAQVEFVDLLRKISQTIQRPLQEPTGQPGAVGASGPRLTGIARG
jgi:cell fate (sporulation/competence/biofilm development) regulator YlbF (YheA/YmcA/DUF963 family)